MLRRHGSLLLAITLVALVASACLVRTAPPPGRGYRAAPAEKHRKAPKPDKHKKHQKHQKHR